MPVSPRLVPMAPLVVVTSGSCAEAACTRSMASDMAAKDTFCPASTTHCTIPVSCTGKNPLGMVTNNAPAPATPPRNTSRVAKRNRSATSSVRA